MATKSALHKCLIDTNDACFIFVTTYTVYDVELKDLWMGTIPVHFSPAVTVIAFGK